ncbi:MAG: TonB-dependent receptor, partial [Hydrogenovibrio sp.]|nr:TonB-dependent receptor [Hydrogenovibrio sp.]
QRNHRDLPLMPANHLKLQSRYDISPWLDGKMPQQTYLGLGVKYTAAKQSAGLHEPSSQFDAMPFGLASTPDYWLWEFQAGTRIKWSDHILRMDLTVENLFDTAYRDFLDTYKGYAQGMGRNFKLTANMAF